MSVNTYLCSIFLINFFASLCAQDPPQFLGNKCSDTNYTRNSTYSSNLETLLSSLSSSDNNTTFFSNGFQTKSLGDEGSNNMVSGFFLCRGDLSPEQCRDCVVFGVNDTLRNPRCPGSKEALTYYDVCIIQYADRDVLSESVDKIGIRIMTGQTVTERQSDRFNEVLSSLRNQAKEEAANSSRKFAVKKANSILSQNIYVMVQCIPTLTRENCLFCLQKCMEKFYPPNDLGGKIIRASCNARYEVYPFFKETLLLPPPVSPPRKPGKGKNSTVIIVAIVVSLFVILLLFVAVYCFFTKKVKKTYETAETPHDDGDDIRNAGSLEFDFKAVVAATDSFSESKKLGQGGFGEVFKGKFPNELEVAVKRLSKTSGQGEREFKNEVAVVAKLQHRNLVKLLGFCLEREEKILIYEFVPVEK